MCVYDTNLLPCKIESYLFNYIKYKYDNLVVKLQIESVNFKTEKPRFSRITKSDGQSYQMRVVIAGIQMPALCLQVSTSSITLLQMVTVAHICKSAILCIRLASIRTAIIKPHRMLMNSVSKIAW